MTPQTRRESRQPLSVVSRLQQPATFLARPHLAGMGAMISHEWFRSSGGGDGVASHVALRALCRSGLPRPTNPDRCGTGSRSGQSRDGGRRGSTLRD